MPKVTGIIESVQKYQQSYILRVGASRPFLGAIADSLTNVVISGAQYSVDETGLCIEVEESPLCFKDLGQLLSYAATHGLTAEAVTSTKPDFVARDRYDPNLGVRPIRQLTIRYQDINKK